MCWEGDCRRKRNDPVLCINLDWLLLQNLKKKKEKEKEGKEGEEEGGGKRGKRKGEATITYILGDNWRN